jgi:hypothetical protein
MRSGAAPAGESGHDGRQDVAVWLVDDIVRNVPSGSACLEIFDELIHGADECREALKDFVDTQL